MKIDVYNQKGEKVEELELPKEIFEVPMNSDLVHQVAVSQMANQRQVIAHTKDRGEVRGGGRKPWRQKGTGRARHGSRRSPIWKGGGVTFGPTKERNFKKDIPKKMRRKALIMVLSAKAKNNFLLILDKIILEGAKTKLMAEIIENLKSNPHTKNFWCGGKEGSILIALPKMDKNLILAARNLPNIKTIYVKDLNCLSLLSYKYLLMPKEAIKIIEKTWQFNF